jgi:hypothetical protein
MRTACWNEDHVTLTLVNYVWASASLFLKEIEHTGFHKDSLCMDRVTQVNEYSLVMEEFDKCICILPTENKPYRNPVITALASLEKNIPHIGHISMQLG